MPVLSAAAAVGFARALVGKAQIPQGKCLNFVWRAFGSHPSTAGAVGHLDTAYRAWGVVVDKHHGDWNPPPGVPVFYGPSPTRTDRNKNAGDVGVSIGGGLGIFTDVSGARVGVMTLAARARQIQRPYLGWGGDLGGHTINRGMLVGTSAGQLVVIELPKENSDMQVMNNTTTGTIVAADQEFVRYLGTMDDAKLAAAVTSVQDEIHKLDDHAFKTQLAVFGIPDKFWTREGLQANGDLWSRESENGKLLERIAAKIAA